MKNKKLMILTSLFVFFIFSTIFLSCKKEDEIKNNVQNGITHNAKTSYTNYSVDKFDIINNPYDIKDYAIYEGDADAEKINNYLLDIGYAFREVIKNQNYNDAIISDAEERVNDCMKFSDFINLLDEDDPTTINLIEVLATVNLTHQSTNPAAPGIEEYIPAIHVANINTANPSKIPLIGIAFEVNSDLEGLEEYEDYIVVWFIDSSGKYHETLINEETVESISNPVLIIDNAEESTTETLKSSIPQFAQPQPSTKNVAQYTTPTIKTYEYKINYRFDNSKHSEFCITSGMIASDGLTYNSLTKVYSKIDNVSKNDIGVLLGRWVPFCYLNYLPVQYTYVYWNTYERDWYCSDKSLVHGMAYNTHCYLTGRRNYTNDWYAWSPSSAGNYPLDISSIYNAGYKYYIFDRSSIKFYKTMNL